MAGEAALCSVLLLSTAFRRRYCFLSLLSRSSDLDRVLRLLLDFGAPFQRLARVLNQAAHLNNTQQRTHTSSKSQQKTEQQHVESQWSSLDHRCGVVSSCALAVCRPSVVAALDLIASIRALQQQEELSQRVACGNESHGRGRRRQEEEERSASHCSRGEATSGGEEHNGEVACGGMQAECKCNNKISSGEQTRGEVRHDGRRRGGHTTALASQQALSIASRCSAPSRLSCRRMDRHSRTRVLLSSTPRLLLCLSLCAACR